MATRDNAPRNSSDENAQHRSNALLGSNDTLESRQNDTANDPDGETDAGEQGKGSSTPPHPVGFWDKRLRKTRLAIYGLWARTSTFSTRFEVMRTKAESINSSNALGVYPGRPIAVLGGPVSRSTKPFLSKGLRSRF